MRFSVFFYFLNVLKKFSTGKITQITFPDSGNVGNVSTNKDNGMTMTEISIVVF